MPKINLDSGIETDPQKDLRSAIKTLSRKRNFPSFIESYLKFTENQESTKKIHLWVAISIIAAAMERKVFLNAGHFTIFPNLYVFIIGESGVVRKSTSTGIGVELLREIQNVSIMSERVTAAALLQQMQRSHREIQIEKRIEKQSAVFCYASELVVLLREVYGSISELLTTFYDCSPRDSSKPWVYETKGEGALRIYGPCLNILGASTPAWLAKAIPANEMEGGFSSRVIFVVERENPDNFVAWPELSKEIESMRPQLIEDLEQIACLRGNFTKTKEAHEFYEKWYIEHKTNAIRKANADGRFTGYHGRKPTTVVKLAMILSASEGNSMEFDKRHIEMAIKLCDDLEASMYDAFGSSGNNRLGEGMFKIVELMMQRKRMTHTEIMTNFWRDYTGKEISEIMKDLMEMKKVKMRVAGQQIIYDFIDDPGKLVS